MFPCDPSMVEDLRRASEGAPDVLAAACKSLRNACIGAPKRKRRFVEYGIIPALTEVVIRRPSESREALVTLGSLTVDDDTLERVVECEELAKALWSLVMNPSQMGVAEAAARVLKSVLALRPDYCARWECSQHDILFLVQCESVVLSTLGARLVSTLCLSQPTTLGSTLASMRPLCESIALNFARSNDDALALAAIGWINPDVMLLVPPELFRWGLSMDSINLNHHHHISSSLGKDSMLLRILYDFWCVSLSSRSPRPVQGVPPPSSCIIERTDALAITEWALSLTARGSGDAAGAIGVQQHASSGDSGRLQRELASIQGVSELLLHPSSTALVRKEAALAVAVFCALDMRRQDRVGIVLDALVQQLVEGQDCVFTLVSLVCATWPSEAGLSNARAILVALFKHPSAASTLLGILSEKDNPANGCAMRLARHLTFPEESRAQVIKLGIHTPLIRALSNREDDAFAALANLAAAAEESPALWSACEEMTRRAGAAALDRNNAAAWALLGNLAAGRNLESKRAFVQSGISLPRLVSERGLPVLRNFCAGGSEHAALIESLMGPALTLVASGIDFASGAPLLAPLGFMCNAAACGETFKSAILSDTRLLNVVSRGLEYSQSDETKLEALRCIINLMWTSSEGDEAQSGSSGRSPMLRLVQAHVMAAARNPMRFTGMQASSGASLNPGRQRLASLGGMLDRIRRIATEGNEGFLKSVAKDVLNALT